MQANTHAAARFAAAKPVPVVSSVEREVLRPADAARFLGCCRATLYRFVANGELKPRKLGRATLFMTADLRAMLDRAAVPGAVKGRVVGGVS